MFNDRSVVEELKVWENQPERRVGRSPILLVVVDEERLLRESGADMREVESVG